MSASVVSIERLFENAVFDRLKGGIALHKLRETRITLGTALVLCAAAAAVAAVICAGALGWRTDAVQDKLRALDRVVSAHYVGEADAETVADYAATGYVAGLGDQWSSYIRRTSTSSSA